MATTRLLPEWAPQTAVLLTWPHDQGDWLPFIDAVDKTYGQLAYAISQYENLVIVCNTEQHRFHIESILTAADVNPNKVHFYIIPSNDSWCRDHGPISVQKDKQTVLLDFIFNGWGNKFIADLDNQITAELHQQNAFAMNSVVSINVVLEGGSIDCDGHGTLLTTRECLLAPTRNPQLDQNAIEQLLMKELGVDRILWLEGFYLDWDDTDGHIDTIARFTDPHTICYLRGPETIKMEQELTALRDYEGNPYKLIPLPLPMVLNNKGERLPSSYANFLIINNAVLVPTYGISEDKTALAQIKKCFPDREVIGIDCRVLIEQRGSLHCATMQLY